MYKYTQVAGPVLVKMMNEQQDSEILTDALWALSYLTDGDEERIQTFLDLNILNGLFKMLE